MVQLIAGKKRRGLLRAGLALLLVDAVGAAGADQIFLDGKIMTPTGWVQAIAVDEGVITRVGTRAEVLAEKTSATRLVDLQGRTVLPGLYDLHVHAFFGGEKKRACALPTGAAAAAIVAAVKQCVDAASPGEWVTGGSWVGAAFAPGEQNKALLDAVSPDNPVVLDDESLHSAWANSKALELAGITRETADPEGGVIDRDSDGEPTGVLRESAARAVMDVVPKADLATQVAAIQSATDEMLSYGIVGFMDASIRADYIGVFPNMPAVAG